MKSEKLLNEKQKFLFDIIKKLSPDKTLASVISGLLGGSNESAYRRIRGEVPLYFEEAVILCNHFHISMDSLVGGTGQNQILCNYSPLNLTDVNDYLIFVKNASDSLERSGLSHKCEIILSAIDIPLFHVLPYRELTLFKLFSGSKSVYGCKTDYDTFAKEVGTNKCMDEYHEKTMINYQLIPSTEIWTDSTTDAIIKLLNYHYEMNHFNDKKTFLSLCGQLSDLINNLQAWVEKGVKGPKEVPFRFYLSDTDVGNSYILFKNAETSSCFIKLYTINGLITSDKRFCKETENWLINTAHRSTLISGASEKIRFNFFEEQMRKINVLMDKIEGRL